MANTKGKTPVTDLDELDVDPAELEEVSVGGDVDAWIAEMLAGPVEDEWF